MISVSETRRRHVNLRDRYRLEGAREPANGLGAPPRSANVHTGIVAIVDPMPDLHTGQHGRLLATVNRKVDILEMERSRRLISDEAYNVGRLAQAVFEQASGPTGGGQWLEGSRVDVELAKELATIRGLDNARAIQAHLAAITRLLGVLDARIVAMVLRDGMTYEQVAIARGRAGERGTSYYAARFRDALETLAEARAKLRR